MGDYKPKEEMVNSQKVSICNIKPEESKIVSELIRQDVRKINSRDINKNQEKAWERYYSPRRVKKFIKEMSCFEVKKGKKILGVVFFDHGELEALYVRTGFVGRGMGTRLLKFIESFAKKNEFKKIKLISSKFAEDFYKNNRYKYIKPAYPSLFGIKFHEAWMEKMLK